MPIFLVPSESCDGSGLPSIPNTNCTTCDTDLCNGAVDLVSTTKLELGSRQAKTSFAHNSANLIFPFSPLLKAQVLLFFSNFLWRINFQTSILMWWNIWINICVKNLSPFNAIIFCHHDRITLARASSQLNSWLLSVFLFFSFSKQHELIDAFILSLYFSFAFQRFDFVIFHWKISITQTHKNGRTINEDP